MVIESMAVIGVVTFASYLATKGVYRKIDNHATFNKILNEGLYHFTSEENCKKIIESGFVKASSKFKSYSNVAKSFFFAGVPSFEDMIMNFEIGSISSKLTAVKIKPTFEQLASFKTRNLNDSAIVYDGNCIIDDKNVSISYFVTDLDKNGKIHYTEVDKNIYDEFIPSKEFQDLCDKFKKNRLGFVMKAVKTDMKFSYEKVTTIMNENLHRMKLIKSNVYSNRLLNKSFNFIESIKADIQQGVDKLERIGTKNNDEYDNNVSKSL